MAKQSAKIAKLMSFFKDADQEFKSLLNYDILYADYILKGGRPKTNTNGEVRGYFRFTNIDDILNYKKWENSIDARGIARQREINNLVRKGILESEAIRSIKTFKSEIRYAFSKAIFASISPFYNKIEKRGLIQETKLNILEYKINLILNILLGKVILSEDKDLYESLTINDIELEPKLFKLIKNDFNSKVDEKIEKLRDAQNEIETNNEEYLEDIFFKSKQ
ncbi:hypothetical protein RRG51_03860 [Mycoplasmopsis cynos]|uniref:Mbov_0398 family ICE element protein n=1 Tax=Mycoplasmopsis cynos TaxID=171284 RepID=UPI002AFEBB1C|nr:hypothetical protein [Mycoplasmopsis cynos]WQQ16119.1 hypothetical protein RRG51_03860 [Mycoplasmopsis cynos]